METFYDRKKAVEIWGGVECTIVRVKDQVHDQLALNGHEEREEDLALMADLGLKTIRYPMLWEKFILEKDEFLNKHKRRLEILLKHGITPIAGFLHHGSGPFFTNLLDPDFSKKFADYAGMMARKFPEISFFTPVNEPLTTARFSGLYGIWYPHKKDDISFVTIFLNEIKGIIAAMENIRSFTPDSKLIQTEDLCRIHSTDSLKYQADFENERRWLTYDLLSGNFSDKNMMWHYLTETGIKEKEIGKILSSSIHPAICGFNYYITSERFLDQHYKLYPEKKRGGNYKQRYADVECVRVEEEPDGFYGLLKEAWERYKLPLALTEVHLGCTREEQLRWFMEAYNTGIKLKNEGVDFKAITAWSLFGSFDWISLLQSKMEYYEPGVFDIRSGSPRPTALADLIRKLITDRKADDTILNIPGWWKRDIRKTYLKEKEQSGKINQLTWNETTLYKDVAPLLIIGARGSLGNAFGRICYTRGILHHLVDRNTVDITSENSLIEIFKKVKPWAVINAAGFSRIDEAEKEPIRCFRENTMGAITLAKASATMGIRLVTFSTDQVFNGKKKNPYLEKDITSPLNTFGLSKRMAEERVISINPLTLIIRSSSFFNPWNRDDTLVKIILEAGNDMDIKRFLTTDIIFSPAYVPDLVNATLDLLIDKESGIWHLSSQEGISSYDFAKLALGIAGLRDSKIYPLPSSQIKMGAIRPAYSVLMSSQGIILPPLETVLDKFIKEFSENRKEVIV